MVNVRTIAGLGTLAVGLGIGAAPTTPGVASADASTDWLSSIDSLLGGALSAAPSSGLDLAISFDGYSLFSEGTATADTGAAGNGNFDFAIADGAGATATATGGTGDVAEAEGALASATATAGNYDTAIDIGNNDDVVNYGAYAGADEYLFGGPGDHDLAFVVGDNSLAGAGGSGGPLSLTLAGDHDIAAVFGTGSDAFAGADNLSPGDFDLASAFGDGLNPDATGANFLVDILPTVAGLDSTLSTLLTDIASLF